MISKLYEAPEFSVLVATSDRWPPNSSQHLCIDEPSGEMEDHPNPATPRLRPQIRGTAAATLCNSHAAILEMCSIVAMVCRQRRVSDAG